MVPEKKAAQAPQNLEEVAAVVAQQVALEALAETEEQPKQREERQSAVSPPWYEDESPRKESWTRCHEEWVESDDGGTESEQPRTPVASASGSHRPE